MGSAISTRSLTTDAWIEALPWRWTPWTGAMMMDAGSAETPNGDYLDRLMRRGSFEALWPLFARATKPAKEMTESYSALLHLRPFLREHGPCRAIHIGDGAHARTAAMFALKSDAENISVDPLLNEALVGGWMEQFGIRRFTWIKARIEDAVEQLNALPPMPTVVTFVHAHVAMDPVLDRLRWDAAFTLACCSPGHQLTQTRVAREHGEDRSVLSSGRRFEVLLNRPTNTASTDRVSVFLERAADVEG